jgi:hypothetical protein
VIDRVPDEREVLEIRRRQNIRYSTISKQLAHAKTSDEIKVVERKMKHFAALQAALGKNPAQVIAGFKASATKFKERMQ